MFGFNDKGEFKINKNEKVVNTENIEEDYDDEDESPESIYEEEINPNEMKVVCKKYIDSDDDDAKFRVMILQDAKTKEEYVVFDNFAEFVIRPRYKKGERWLNNNEQ